MKIYIVLGYNYEEEDINKAFNNNEMAQTHADKLNAEQDDDYYHYIVIEKELVMV